MMTIMFILKEMCTTLSGFSNHYKLTGERKSKTTKESRREKKNFIIFKSICLNKFTEKEKKVSVTRKFESDLIIK